MSSTSTDTSTRIERMDQLKQDLKAQIIQHLNLQDRTVESISDDMPLFGDDGLGLDSIDALELIVMLDRQYQVRIKDPEHGRSILGSVNSIAAHIRAEQ